MPTETAVTIGVALVQIATLPVLALVGWSIVRELLGGADQHADDE